MLWRWAVARPEFLCAYMRWSAMRRASLGDGRLLRDGDGAVGRGDREAVSALDQRGGRQQLDLIAAIGVGQDAELVAAEAIGTPVALDAAVERLPEAREERVAGEMAEGVVVALEAVEVEEQEHGGVCAPRVARRSRSIMSRRRLARPVRLSLVAAASSSRREARREMTASVMSIRATARIASAAGPTSPKRPGAGWRATATRIQSLASPSPARRWR